MIRAVEEPCRGVDTFQILSQRRTADLDLGAAVASRQPPQIAAAEPRNTKNTSA
jgi:hypothetical protein